MFKLSLNLMDENAKDQTEVIILKALTNGETSYL